MIEPAISPSDESFLSDDEPELTPEERREIEEAQLDHDLRQAEHRALARRDYFNPPMGRGL